MLLKRSVPLAGTVVASVRRPRTSRRPTIENKLERFIKRDIYLFALKQSSLAKYLKVFFDVELDRWIV